MNRNGDWLLRILNWLLFDRNLLNRLNWHLLGLMLLHFKLCQLLLCIFNFTFRLLDVLILSFKIFHQLLMVNDTLRPIQNICSAHRCFSSWLLSISLYSFNLIFSLIKGLLRKSLCGTELVHLLSDSLWVIFGVNLGEHGL